MKLPTNSFKYRDDDTVEIILPKFKGKVDSIIVDKQDFEKISTSNWVARGQYFSTDSGSTLLHRFILDLSINDVDVVHHKNHITWDNRRCNLECTTIQNNSRIRMNKEERKEIIRIYK